MGWTSEQIAFREGSLGVITGSSGGLGFELANVLVGKGYEIVVAARNTDKGAAAVSKLGEGARFELLDLADFTSVEAFATRMLRQGRPISLLINNAALAGPPKRQVTRNGYEIQFQTNFLSHFLLTARLLPLLTSGLSTRVVTVSSLVEKTAKLDFDDLMSERHYSPIASYKQSKLANLLFARELQRRSDRNEWGLLSVAAHPGISVTELTKSRPGQPVLRLNALFELVSPFIGQSAARGALPILLAATDPDAEPGGYYGPQGFADMKGPPGPARSSKTSQDAEIAARLWLEAERLTGVTF